MKCPRCGNETLLDHVDRDLTGERYYYCCVNPRCGDYRKAFSPGGEEAETRIQPKQPAG